MSAYALDRGEYGSPVIVDPAELQSADGSLYWLACDRYPSAGKARSFVAESSRAFLRLRARQVWLRPSAIPCEPWPTWEPCEPLAIGARAYWRVSVRDY